MKKYSKDFCVGFYSFNSKRHLAVLENASNLLDVITGRKFKLEELESVSYAPLAESLYKYYNQQFKIYCDSRALTDTELYETGIGILYAPLLRFFKLRYSELFESKNTEETLTYVVDKCKKYLSRYVDKCYIKTFEQQASLFSNVVQIFSFLPEEIKSKKVPFWHTIAAELLNDKFVYPLSGGLTDEIVQKCNQFKFDLSYMLQNKDEFCKTVKTMKKDLLEKISSDYRNNILKNAKERLSEANTTLTEELEYAKTVNDTDLLQEVETIFDLIKELESNIEQQVADLPVTIEIIEWWPDLLYPAPKLKFEFTEEYYDLHSIESYFCDCN